jgi:hypothetical protein
METAIRDDVRVEGSKFELGAGGTRIDAGELPWAYGEDRITATVRDPDSAYLYWEVTDPGIAAARSRLGPAGASGWCNLRVYDATGRDFDGTNANDYFDIRVDRADREYFLMIRRPTSTIHVEIGIKTSEGYFQPIARSGRADFPRNSPSPDTSLEWMTVTAEGAPPSAAPCRSRYGGPEPQLPPREGAGYVDVWKAAFAPSEAQVARQQHGPWSGTTHRTFERSAHIERWWHLGEWRAEWRGGLRFTHVEGSYEGVEREEWRAGPFPLALLDPERIAVEMIGGLPGLLHAEGTRLTVYGPWRVVIRSFEREPQRRVLGTWSMHWVIGTTPMIQRWGFALERRRLAGYEREHLIAGASEKHHLLERGASEEWRLGASERMWLGASERFIAGASETLYLGASQLAFAGASALLFAGASERMGASEWMWMGASERMRASIGGSEWVGGSAWMGASEQAPGVQRPGEKWASRPEGAPPPPLENGRSPDRREK